ncbi:LOW QUALITY PROTEIN: hypothetical protein Smp_144960 [Schistosoma mansoni]|uniref:hypothetical protein n=1 Tax=Schistosoma mansoni TaxID=6183 RepID=UPI00022DC83A|nr:LOW QUALITY PROTEIN: hypothetical protein Smp_144960 [Schistosoma mansoni]|eukprot:XP_018652272.1 LOW QUALITY PROTEIN: hypothetical protein Smp_144960 [Schistosoma mansoni]
MMCRKSGDPSKSIVFDMALNLCVFETLFQWNFVFTGADLEAYKVRELQFYDSLIGSNGDLYLSHEAFVIPFMATMHHCSLRSCLLVERALVRLLNTVCAILSTQFKHELVQDNSLSSSSTTSCPPLHHKQHNDNKNNDALHLFRRLCMGVVDLGQIGTSFTSDINHTTNNNNSNNDSSNVYWERCNSITSGGLISSLKIMESIDWAMCLESTPYVFRDGDLGWQARDSLLLIAAYSLRDEEFSHSIAKYSSICAVIATGLGILYTALPHRLVNNNSPESWPILIRTLNTNQLANARFNEFLDALDFCRSLLEIAHPLIQSCLLHCIHAIFFVSIIGPALTQKAPEDVITATVYLEQFIIHTVGSSLLPILLRFLLMKLPSTIIFDANSQMNQMTTSTSTTPEGISPAGSYQSSSVEATLKDDNNSSVFSPESNDDPSLFDENQFTTSNSITYMDLIIARIHQCNSLIVEDNQWETSVALVGFCQRGVPTILKHLIPVRDHLFNIGWTWPDPSTVTDASTKLLNLSSSSSSMNFNLDSARFKATTDESIIHHSDSYHYHQHEQHRQPKPNHRNNTVAQLDIDNVEEFNYSSDQSMSKELHNKHEELEVLEDCNKYISLYNNNTTVNNHNDLTQQTSLPELSSSHSSPTPPSSISSMYNNDSTINSSNSMLDWLSYTSWAHQTIKIRKHACKTWQLIFDANQPTKVTTRYEKTGKFSEYDCRIGLDPYKIYTDYKCFINRNCYTNLDLEINANELQAKALCSAATKLNIDTDLDLDGSENLDDCLPVVESDQYTDKSQQEQQTYHEKLLSNQQIHKSVSVRNPICMSHSIDHSLCTCFKKPKESFENSTETFIHTKLYDKSLIKSWYRLNFLDSFDINEQVNVHNTLTNIMDTTNIEDNSKIKQEGTHPQSLVGGQSECSEQMLHNHNEEYVTNFMDSNSNHNCYYSEDKSCELNKFIEELENFSSENLLTNFNILDGRQEQLKIGKRYLKNTNDISRCNSLSSLHNHINESLSPTKGFSDSQLDKSFNKITRRAKSLTGDTLHSNTTTTSNSNNNHERHHHHHQHRDNYCEMGFNHGSLNNLIQTRLMNDTNSHDNFNSPCSLVLMSSTDTKEKVKEMNEYDLINCKQCHLSPSRVQMNCLYKKPSPFLTTLFNRLENFTNNCFYANLYLTNLISSLASYPIPLLRAILFLTNTTQFTQSMAMGAATNSQIIRAINDNVLYYLPYNILCLIKEQIELFTVLYTRQVRYIGSLDTLNGYSFDVLKQEARRYLNCETIDLSKLSISMDTSTMSLGVEKKKKNLKSTNSSHKESKLFTTDKQNISPMMNSNRRSYFRKWFSLSFKSNNNNNNKNSDNISTSGKNLKNTRNTSKTSQIFTNVLNPKDLLDFSQILQKPMTEFTFLIDLDSNYQQLINNSSDQHATTIRGSSSNGNDAQQRRRSFRLSTIKRLKTNVNTKDRTMSMMMMNTENSILDVSKIQRMVLCAVIFEDFCKELAAICTEHSVQW